MPTLVVENLPAEVYEGLQQRAAARRRSVPDEVTQLLREALHQDTVRPPRLPDLVPTVETSAPFDFPRSVPGALVSALPGGQRLPDLLD